jgi:hypothetical protein
MKVCDTKNAIGGGWHAGCIFDKRGHPSPFATLTDFPSVKLVAGEAFLGGRDLASCDVDADFACAGR